MHALSRTASIRTYHLDLVYLNAALQAGNQLDLATQVQAAIATLKHERIELERAEELEMVASATVAARDANVAMQYKSAAAHVRAHHPAEYDHYFPKSPTRVTEGAMRSEIDATRTLVRHLGELPATDPVRTEFVPALTRAADHLEQAIAQKDEVLSGFAVVRAALDRARAQVNLKRIEIHGLLEARLNDRKLADKFFRPAAPHSAATDTTPTTAPAAS